MRRGLIVAAILLVASLWLPGQKGRPAKGKDKEKPPDLEIVELKIHRGEKVITVDGRVRNISAKPMKGVVLFLEFLESDNKMISRMIAEVTKDAIEPGDDESFEMQTKDQSRAVSVRVDAEDRDGRYFIVNKPGPYEID